ncbi:hypothetical protein R8Z57_08780 [Microbacterium sp. M3]|uniref:Uncharacterized protein n=1 Tax=Microbacterium arthrosphaerae TaxID=792652 RepID=A0ABU4H0L1_9MICO|nr:MULTISPECIES: hypothetical protein [Microbacterium]MDW4572866.1 hypothetical protein [Microbacterium arthrosphaerae]MDW7606721.1 hypothetical protein [Microbacterium sp. M3]
MNTLLAPQRRDPYQRVEALPATLQLSSRDTRTSLVDRAALHLGLRLLLWSTRTPRLADDRTRHAQAFRHQEATAQRERAYLCEAAALAPRQ